MKIADLKDTSGRREVRWRMLATVGLVGAAVAFSVWYFSPGAKQGRSIAVADRHIALVLGPVLKADGRFPRVELDSFTGEGGSIAVVGEVATWSEAAELRELVMGTHPACAVFWAGLYVKEGEEREPPDPALLERVTMPEKAK